MFMPTPVFYDEDIPYGSDGLPDELKVPESHEHRQACDVIGLAAVELLGADYQVFRDMNWYPTDGGHAIAPDVMILPAGSLAEDPETGSLPKSYRQDLTDGPRPVVNIEVPSHHDRLLALMAKIERCRSLGVPVYLVTAEGPPSVLRYDPNQASPESWVDRPIDELGGLKISFVDDGDGPPAMEVELPNGLRARTDHDLMRAYARQAESQARAELERLREQLRQHGIEPD